MQDSGHLQNHFVDTQLVRMQQSMVSYMLMGSPLKLWVEIALKPLWSDTATTDTHNFLVPPTG